MGGKTQYSRNEQGIGIFLFYDLKLKGHLDDKVSNVHVYSMELPQLTSEFTQNIS